jgi:hypothetical protein
MPQQTPSELMMANAASGVVCSFGWLQVVLAIFRFMFDET